MMRTLILAGLLYGHYATGQVWYLYAALGTMHIVQESIIGVVKQQVRGVRHATRQTETETDETS